MRWLMVAAAAAVLLGLFLLLVHVAHCDKANGDCNICKIVTSVVLPAAMAVLLFFGAGSICLSGKPPSRLHRRACSLGPVRAPPCFS